MVSHRFVNQIHLHRCWLMRCDHHWHHPCRTLCPKRIRWQPNCSTKCPHGMGCGPLCNRRIDSSDHRHHACWEKQLLNCDEIAKFYSNMRCAADCFWIVPMDSDSVWCHTSHRVRTCTGVFYSIFCYCCRHVLMTIE